MKLSDNAINTMRDIGNYSPTEYPSENLVVGRVYGPRGEVKETYLYSHELKRMAKGLIEVAEWLEQRSESSIEDTVEDHNTNNRISKIDDNVYLIFGGQCYYGAPGADSLLAIRNNYGEAVTVAKEMLGKRFININMIGLIEWTHILYLSEGCIIARFGDKPYAGGSHYFRYTNENGIEMSLLKTV